MNQMMISVDNQGKWTASNTCMCGKVTSAEVSSESLFAWNNGALVQDAFRMLDDNTREAIFVSGMCARCWDDMFASDDWEFDPYAGC